MKRKNVPVPPFFEIGPKSYLYGDDILELALAADRASEKYGVDIIFTTPYTEIRRVAEAVKRLFVYAPHMDLLEPGRGLADILPEAVKAAGAAGVMLNHCEKPLSLGTLENPSGGRTGSALPQSCVPIPSRRPAQLPVWNRISLWRNRRR